MPGARRCLGTPRRRVLPTTIASTASPAGISTAGLWPPPQSASVNAPSRSADRLVTVPHPTGRIAGPHPLPSRQFQALFDSLFKNLPPDWGCIPKQPDSPTAPRGATRVRAQRGSHPLRRHLPVDLGPVRR
ncbi:unnamed protein product [Prunus brigantina]